MVYEEKIRSINIKESTRILGVYRNLSLSWKSQFEVMREKLCK